MERDRQTYFMIDRKVSNSSFIKQVIGKYHLKQEIMVKSNPYYETYSN